MPTVSRVEGPSVGLDALPGVRSTSRLDSDYADAGARGLARVGAAVGQVIEQEQAKVDTTQVLEAKRKLSDWERSWFDPQNEKGVYGRKGRDALQLEEEVAPDFDRVSSELVAGIRSDKAKQTFLAMAESQRDSVLGRVQQHALREHEAYVENEHKASVLSATDMAARAALDGRYEDQAREVSIGLAAIRANAVNQGEPSQLTTAKEREFLSTVHASAINGFLATGSIDEALKYFDANADDLSATAEAEIRSKMNPQLLETMADRIEAAVTTGQPLPTGTAASASAAGTIAEAERVAVASVGRTISLESGGKADAKNPRSSATGAAQFISDTWLRVAGQYAPQQVAGKSRAEILEMRKDPAMAKLMAEAYAKENARFLFQSGLPVTEETVYMAHRFGPGGAAKILRAPPETQLASLVSPQVLQANPDLRGKSVADLSASHARRAGEQPAAGGSGGGGSTGTMPALVVTGRTSAEALRDHARTVPNVLLRKTLENRADKLEAQAEQDRRQYEREMTDRIWEKVGAAEGRARPANILTPDELAFARDNKMLGEIDAEQLRKLKGTLIHDDPELVQRLQILAVDHPDRFKQLNLGKYARVLTPTTRAEFKKLQVDIDKPDKQIELATDAQRLDSMARVLGYDRLDKPARDKREAELGIFWRMTKRSFVEQNKREPIGKEADELAVRVQRMVAQKPELGRGARAAEMIGTSPQDQATVRTVLRNRLKRNPTQAEVQAAMAAYYQSEIRSTIGTYPELQD